jgi:hypothetical protein
MNCAVDKPDACESFQFLPVSFALLLPQPRQVTYAWADSYRLNAGNASDNLKIHERL